jgi:hypothetical protein
MFIDRIGCVLFLFASAAALFGQEPTGDQQNLKSERRAKLIERISGEADQLKLSENRALVNVKLGAALWETDKDAAKSLFRSAIADLIAAQQAAEAGKNPNNGYHDLLNSQSLRPQILNTIAGADAEFALEQFYRSRPSAIERALAGDPLNAKIGSPSNERMNLAQSEINLEQRLVKMVAEQKPEKAVAILKDSIRKKLSGETFGMLQKLFVTDPAAANGLANEVLDRLSREKFFSENQPNYDLINLSNSILAEYVRERDPEHKAISLEEPRVRTLALKIIDVYLTGSQRMGHVPLEQLEPLTKRFAPTSFEQLKTISGTLRGFGHHRIKLDSDYQKLMESNPSPELMVSEAKRYDPETRRTIYVNAANKFSESGQYQNAVSLLNEQFEGDALENAVSSLNWYQAHQLVQKGQFDAAESMMMEFNDSNRISALVSLAQTVYGADRGKNRSRAISILNRARSLMPERPENNNELNQLFSLINAKASIEPAEALAEFEALTDQLNRIIEASAIVTAFQGGYLRQGEYLLSNGFNFGVYIDPNMFRTFAQGDYARTEQLIDMFTRREVRIMLKLYVAEGGLL